MTRSQQKELFTGLLYNIFRLLLTASIISYYKSYHYVIGLFFIGTLLLSFIKSYRNKAIERSVYYLSMFGVFFTLIMGLFAEIWGTTNGYWVYHGIPENISIPFWVPFAWGLAYKALYRVEKILLPYFKTNIQKWFFCIILPVLVLPVLGEIIVIYFGTWNYTWQPQLLGMPLMPVILLVIFHVSIFTVMCKISQYYSINDPVYGSIVTIKKKAS